VPKILPRVATVLILSALFGSVAAAQSFTVVLPAAASLHGLPPAFFHSDVVVFNRSTVRTAVVRATYRCTTGACGSPQVFEVAPRRLRLIEDIAASLFGAPETSGAIEFSSTEPIVVASRLYSPARPAPTLGMFVPGLGPDRAFASSDLVNLSHSHDPSVGFRTNIGVFNPSDQTRTVHIRCIDPRGNLGFINQEVGPHQLFQINDGDLFREFSILRTAATFSCLVSGGAPILPLYSWAAVIDNQSNDAMFVVGQQFFVPPRVVTVPAAASLHGGAGTFFRSDLAVFNDDVAGLLLANARYRCFLGPCTESQATLDVGPGATAIFSDAVATLFAAPESAGWIELNQTSQIGGRMSVTSRLYTPGPFRGTVGMSVPGLEPRDGTASQVLPLLSKGSRVNVGVINPEEAAQVVTIQLFSGAGERLGRLKRLLLRKQATQINDIFHEFGISGDVDAAYVLVEGNSPPLRIFAYAAIIDNASQDPIFVPGQDDPESRAID
jgi:hypothetical protein